MEKVGSGHFPEPRTVLNGQGTYGMFLREMIMDAKRHILH